MDAEKLNHDSSRINSSQTEADTMQPKSEQLVNEASSKAGSDHEGECITYVSGVRYAAISLVFVSTLLAPSQQVADFIQHRISVLPANH